MPFGEDVMPRPPSVDARSWEDTPPRIVQVSHTKDAHHLDALGPPVESIDPAVESDSDEHKGQHIHEDSPAFAPAECTVDTDTDMAKLLGQVNSLIQGQARMEKMLNVLVSTDHVSGSDVFSPDFRKRGSAKVLQSRDSTQWCTETISRSASRMVTRSKAWFENLSLHEELVGSDQALGEVLGGELMMTDVPTVQETTISKTQRSSLRWLLHLPVLPPTSNLRSVIDVLSMVVLAYDLIANPYFLAFGSGSHNVFNWLSHVSLSYWLLDIIVNFRTGFYHQGVLQMRARIIAVHYIRGSFALDFFIVAIDLVTIVALNLEESIGSGSVRLMRVLKVARLMRLASVLRVRRVRGRAGRLGGQPSNAAKLMAFVVSTCEPLLLLLWLCHMMACLWYFLGHEFADTSDTGVSWLDLTTGGKTYSSYDDAYRYTTSLHFAMTQMTPGSMQVFPQNTNERIFNLFCLVGGLLIFSTLISQISANVTNFKIQMQTHRAKMDALNNFLGHNKVEHGLRQQIVALVEQRLMEKRPLVVKDVHELKTLSSSLRNRLQIELCAPHLLHHPYFNYLSGSADKGCWEETCKACCDFSMLMAHEVLFSAGERAKGMYFLADGNIAYSTGLPGGPVASSSPLGESARRVRLGSWLSEAAMWCPWQHVGSAAVTTSRYCQVLQINPEKFLQVLKTDARIGLVTWAYASSFVAFLKSPQATSGSEPDDLRLPFGVDEVISAMPKEAIAAFGEVALNVLKEKSESMLGNWFNIIKSDRTEALIEEVREGKSALLVSKEQGVFRCVPLVTVQLRQLDGRVLVRLRLARQADGSLQATCQLPGSKLDAEEQPEACFQRLLARKLKPVSEGVEVVGRDRQIEWADSKDYGVQTNYVRTIMRAVWRHDPAQLNEFLVHQPTSTTRATSTTREETEASVFAGTDVYSFPGGDCYAWLSEEDFVFLGSKRGQGVLTNWLSLFGQDTPLLKK